MTMNELPYEEYRGWYIGQGITMPAQGIREINIYSSIGDVAIGEAFHVVHSVEEAKRWIDEQVRGPVVHRAFPQTYDDWVSLAEGIKQVDPTSRYPVDYRLSLIRLDLPGADDAKRWLVSMGKELGMT